MSAPAIRQAARVLLLDRAGRVLLFKGHDPARPELGSWWFTVGGGVDEGETVRQAGRMPIRIVAATMSLCDSNERFVGDQPLN